jgi:hypothetical protein
MLEAEDNTRAKCSMNLQCFDFDNAKVHLQMSSPEGWEEFGICDACLPDAPSRGAYVALLSAFFESQGFERDHHASYTALTGFKATDDEYRLFRRQLSPRVSGYVVISQCRLKSSPDVSARLHVTGPLGWFAARRLRRQLQVARQSLSSGWLQPFISHHERPIFDADADFGELCQVATCLQGYLYSGGAGTLPDSLESIFAFGWQPVDLSRYRLIETGPTMGIWGARPVLECSNPIQGLIFGCTASNQIVPLGRANT